jgi:hypothetical protein
MATIGLARDNVSEGIATNSKNYQWFLSDDKRNWLFLIETVSSVDPMSVDRISRIKSEYAGKAGLVFVTAFQDWSVYKKFVGDIA